MVFVDSEMKRKAGESPSDRSLTVFKKRDRKETTETDGSSED